MAKKEKDEEKEKDKKVEPVPIIPIEVPPLPLAPGVDAESIDAAIARGVGYLKKPQQADGTWAGAFGAPYTAGVTALGGLALLECNVPASDPAVVKAAQFVRNNALNLGQNYEISATILFLNRLGQSRDIEIIQQLVLRLTLAQDKPAAALFSPP